MNIQILSLPFKFKLKVKLKLNIHEINDIKLEYLIFET